VSCVFDDRINLDEAELFSKVREGSVYRRAVVAAAHGLPRVPRATRGITSPNAGTKVILSLLLIHHLVIGRVCVSSLVGEIP
jgi:hypothetical protein